MTGKFSDSHNGHLVVPSETGKHGFWFSYGLMWANSLLLPVALSASLSPKDRDSDHCLVGSSLLGAMLFQLGPLALPYALCLWVVYRLPWARVQILDLISHGLSQMTQSTQLLAKNSCGRLFYFLFF